MVREGERSKGNYRRRQHYNGKRLGAGGGGKYIPKPLEVPERKGCDSVYDCRRFSVCPGCRFYEEHTVENQAGLVFVVRRWCRRFHTEISNLGSFIGCKQRREEEMRCREGM